jgi:hypothetical protein
MCQDKMMRWVLITWVFLFETTGCTWLCLEDIPSESAIRKWGSNRPFIIEPLSIAGIYRNMDQDAIVFRYVTAVDEDVFWERLQSGLRETKWRKVSNRSNIQSYERSFSKNDMSADRPDMSRFFSIEHLEIAYSAADHAVTIGCIQADFSAEPDNFAATDAAKWAEKEIWPRFWSATRGGGFM